MNFGKLNSTVILIDKEFLDDMIKENVQNYKNIYPNKQFDRINLSALLYSFLLNARVEESGHYIDVLFAFKSENPKLYYCEPSDMPWDATTIETEKGDLIVRSFFADEDETCRRHFNSMLDIFNFKFNKHFLF